MVFSNLVRFKALYKYICSWLLKKVCGLVQNGQCEKSCEIKGGGQEMAVMVQDDEKYFNSNSGQFAMFYPNFIRNQHKIHLNCC